jgi:leucyl aminopeptidase
MANALTAADAFIAEDAEAAETPIWLVEKGAPLETIPLDEAQRGWVAAAGFKGAAKQHLLVPAADGRLAGVLLGIGEPGAAAEPSGPPELLLGQLAQALPPGLYRLASKVQDATLAAIAWGLGAYRYSRYKNADAATPAQLRMPEGVDRGAVLNSVYAVWQGRDLINTPACDMGPAELEAAARALAARHGANVTVIAGDDLLAQNFPMIHAVGRASSRAPRLIDLAWGREGAPTVTLIGKGICFDTGGLDLKPASGMLLMKKDMGGAATALTLGHMIMGQKLDVRLRILIPAAENSVSGNAFRPGDILQSRGGRTVEVGNTDAEGRLVLADAIALADEEAPDSMFVFATLTGAARVALGPDVPAFFSDDEKLATALTGLSAKIGDPVWRLPLWPGYDGKLDSTIADMNNVWDAPFAGAIVAALFLKRFVKRARRFAHFDLYGWRPSATPLGPKGGEPQAARAVFALLKEECAP